MSYDHQSSSENVMDLSETEGASSIAGAGKYLSSCSPDYSIKHFISFETEVHSLANPISAARDTKRQSTATYLSLPPLFSYSYQRREIARGTQERSQPKKELLEVPSRSGSRPPAVIQQQTSESATPVPPVSFASFYKHTRSFTPVINEVISNDGKSTKSSQDEDKCSSIEIPNLRSPQILASLRRAAQIGSFPARPSL